MSDMQEDGMVAADDADMNEEDMTDEEKAAAKAKKDAEMTGMEGEGAESSASDTEDEAAA